MEVFANVTVLQLRYVKLINVAYFLLFYIEGTEKKACYIVGWTEICTTRSPISFIFAEAGGNNSISGVLLFIELYSDIVYGDC